MPWFFLLFFRTTTKEALYIIGVASAVRSSMQESLVQILSPKKRIDILRDVMDAKKRGKPYVIVFCGVNGVGKSTNLAKVGLIFLTIFSCSYSLTEL